MTELDTPTPTEIALAASATILAINTRQLLANFEDIAAKHDIVPSPRMYESINSAIDNLHWAISRKAILVSIADDIAASAFLEAEKQGIDKGISG